MFSWPFVLELNLLGLNHKKYQRETSAKYQHGLKTEQLLESLGQTIGEKGGKVHKSIKDLNQ